MSKKRFLVKACVDRARGCFDDPPELMLPRVLEKPKGPDPRIQRDPVPDPEQRTEAAPVSGVRMPPASSRGVKHPPIPQPAQRPANMRKDEWFRRSTPEKSYLHDACARGVA